MRDALAALPSINATLKEAGLQPILPSTEEVKTVTPASTPASDSETEDH
jgi:hypothetical protein